MKAFKLEASDSQHVVDALNAVSNNYALSVNDLSKAIRKSSASMAAGNNSLEQTFGLVTAGKFHARLHRNMYVRKTFNCWKLLRAMRLQHNNEIYVSVNV